MLDIILCVDDDPITLLLSRKVITKASFSNEIITAQNGEEALHYFNTLTQTNLDTKSNKLPQLVFLDLNMPIMNGWEFLDLFSSPDYSNFNNTKVIILSSTIDPEDIKKAKTYPMVVDFLSKPITSTMLEYVKAKIQ